jgi:hypothetical protein
MHYGPAYGYKMNLLHGKVCYVEFITIFVQINTGFLVFLSEQNIYASIFNFQVIRCSSGHHCAHCISIMLIKQEQQ